MFVILSALMVSLLIIGTPQALASLPRENAYAIYLSPGFEKGVGWGGYHVTIAGFSKNHAPGKSEKEEAKNAWDEANGGKVYSFVNKKYNKDYWACYLGKPYGWGICFYSDTLDRMAKELIKKKFDDVRKGGNWHISLYCDTKEAAIKRFEKDLKNKPWKLFEVRWPSSDCRDKGKTCNEDYWTEIK